jgi:hypothetical protein
MAVLVSGGLGPLTRLDIGTGGRGLDNVTVDVVGGPSGITSGTSVTLPSNTPWIDLRIRRLDSNRPATVPLTVFDGCGPWTTFVGGGVGAF